MRHRRAPLSAWLGLLIVLAVTLPALGAVTAWWAVEARQRADLGHRAARAAALIAQHKTLDPALSSGLAALDVEAELGVPPAKQVVDVTKDTAATKSAKVAAIQREDVASGLTKPGASMTAGLQAMLRSKPNGKDVLQAKFVQRTVPGANLFLPKPSRSARIAGAGVAALALLTLLMAAGYALLRRWVVQPLARMSADVEQVAGGDIAIAPVATRAREVADIGTALNGMGGGLRAALAERDAAEDGDRP
jgi:nitrate/nitrite-specific signal transduction histidine kinase